MKKLIMVLLALFCATAHAGPIANIEYIHALIKQRHGIDIEYSPELADPRLAANMKYLLSVVDIANTRINRAKFTNYGENETYATLNAADTDTVITAVDDLIVKIEYPFHFTPAVETNEYMFQVGAAGTFYIDWGDGNVERVVKTAVGYLQITHTYDTAANNYTIGLGGKATGYDYGGTSAIRFDNDASRLSEIDGCLGCVFSTIKNASASTNQPSFGNTFQNNNQLTGEIPPNLFGGIYGQPPSHIFNSTFSGCTSLSGEIPENLFAGLNGLPSDSMFYRTFQNCTGLTGSIPENLFSGISGRSHTLSFAQTFAGCTGLTGSIPEKLFAGISVLSSYTFHYTFSGCTGLTGEIPPKLFANVQGAPKLNVFAGTFSGCTGLSGKIPENLFAGVNGAPYQNMFAYTFRGCTGLTGEIPGNLFAGISGAPAVNMFQRTFDSCTGLTGEIPENLFAGINGAPAPAMFAQTFIGCKGLTGIIPGKLFSGIQGPPAENMFNYTFGNVGATEIGSGLFAGIQGAPAQNMFAGAFRDMPNLTQIPSDLFSGIDDTAPAVTGMFGYVFYNDAAITGESPKINGRHLYEIWDTGGTAAYRGARKLTDWADIPDTWK